jgi:signal transduction histidine kinase
MSTAGQPLDPYTILLTVGVLYTLMPLTVWTVLQGRHNRTTLALWCVGALLTGVNYMLFGLRGVVPSFVTLQLANALGFTGHAMRWAALRRERGLPVRVLPLAAVVALAVLAYLVAAETSVKARVSVATVALIVASTALARESWMLARSAGSRSAQMVAITYLMLALAALLRLLIILATPGDDPVVFDFTLDVYLLLFVGLLTALWGNIGYMGFAIEQAERRVAARTAELAVAQAGREVAERQAAAMKALSDERQELLRVISHEARQPLHNAQAVLQGVDDALHTGVAASEAAAARIARARSVLRQITASLDNTLAASTVLVESDRTAALRDVDIDMLIELCLGDLPQAERARVDVVRQTDVRTAAMDIGLMRLALRNLLANAFKYGQPGTPVVVTLQDSDEPLALLIDVGNQGPAVPDDLVPRMFERGVRGRHGNGTGGRGLGLYLVQRVMELHGGSAELLRNTPEGIVVRLVLVQAPAD